MFLVDGEQNNVFLIIAIVIALIIALIIAFIIINNVKKNKFLKQRNAANNELIDYLGGIDNIIKANAMGSRLSLVLDNYDLVNEEKIKELGVSTIIRMSNKITLVIGEDAKDIESLINKN